MEAIAFVAFVRYKACGQHRARWLNRMNHKLPSLTSGWFFCLQHRLLYSRVDFAIKCWINLMLIDIIIKQKGKKNKLKRKQLTIPFPLLVLLLGQLAPEKVLLERQISKQLYFKVIRTNCVICVYIGIDPLQFTSQAPKQRPPSDQWRPTLFSFHFIFILVKNQRTHSKAHLITILAKNPMERRQGM